MRKKRDKTNFKFSNRLHYTLIFIVAIILLSVGVYAYIVSPSPGTNPNPGHNLSTIAPPAGCTGGQYLRYVTIESVPHWECATPPSMPSGYLSGYEIVSRYEDSEDMSIGCPTGKVVLGGGCEANTYGISIEKSVPVTSYYWSCRFSEADAYNTVRAICASIN